MKRKLYNLFVPKAIRTHIYQANVRHFEECEVARVRAAELALPAAELSAVYIANLQILTDRHALLHALPKHAIVGEVGVRCGEFSDTIWSITCPQRLHLLGGWSTITTDAESSARQRALVELKFRAEMAAGQVIVQPGPPLAELDRASAGYFDWLYLDAGYSFTEVSALLERCQRTVKPTGIIAGGNYAAGFVMHRARYGVIEAVNTFCKQQGWELLYLTNECHRQLSYAIRKMEP